MLHTFQLCSRRRLLHYSEECSKASCSFPRMHLKINMHMKDPRTIKRDIVYTSLYSHQLHWRVKPCLYTSCFSSWPFRLSPLGFELCLLFSRYFCASFLVVVLVFFAILFHLSHLALLLFLLSFVVVMVVVVVVLLPLAGFHRTPIIGAGRLFWS